MLISILHFAELGTEQHIKSQTRGVTRISGGGKGLTFWWKGQALVEKNVSGEKDREMSCMFLKYDGNRYIEGILEKEFPEK